MKLQSLIRSYRFWAIMAACCIAGIIYFNSKQIPSSPAKSLIDSLAVVVEPKIYYGINIDSLEVFESKIQRNESLAVLLKDYKISNQTIHRLAKLSKNEFDLSKLAVGKEYAILWHGDSIKYPTHFIYKPDPIEFIIYDLRDSLHIYQGKNEIKIVEKKLAGTINNSLYLDMLEDGGDADLVNKLVDIFAWEVDFFGIQKGDEYKIIYDDILVDGERYKAGEIKAAYFKHKDKSIFGIAFDQGKGIEYYNEEGKSLRKDFLRAPLSFTRISSRYSGRRYHPVLKRFKAHLGTDYAAPRGTSIYATADGTILKAQYKRNNGNYVKIKHNGNVATQYLHMSKIKRGIRKGVKVKRGQTIGFVGSTGLATGPHLCYRFWKNGKQVDALKVKLPSAKPIEENFKATFDSTQQILVKELKSITVKY